MQVLNEGLPSQGLVSGLIYPFLFKGKWGKKAGGRFDLTGVNLDSIRYQYVVIYAHYLETYNIMHDPYYSHR
jgi:hypothetical protein